MKKRSEEKRKRPEQKNCSDISSTSREQAIAIRKAGVALVELSDELKKTSEYDQHNKNVNHAIEDRMEDLRILFLRQADRQLNDLINTLRRSQAKMRKALDWAEKRKEK